MTTPSRSKQWWDGIYFTLPSICTYIHIFSFLFFLPDVSTFTILTRRTCPTLDFQKFKLPVAIYCKSQLLRPSFARRRNILRPLLRHAAPPVRVD
jgi:hypothetical protein